MEDFQSKLLDALLVRVSVVPEVSGGLSGGLDVLWLLWAIIG